jgi:hypothetical protein
MRHIPARIYVSLHWDNNLVTETTEPSRAHDRPFAQCISDQTHDGGDEEIDDSTNLFPRLACVTRKETSLATFLVDENIVSIKIQKIPSIYEYLNYFLLSN